MVALSRIVLTGFVGSLIPLATLPAQGDPGAPPTKSERTQPQDPTRQDPSRTDSPQGANRADQFLASWLLIGNDNEIALAQYAIGKAKSDEVKRFAEMMVTDHKKLSDKLQPFAGPRLDADPTKRPEDASGQRPKGSGTGKEGEIPSRTGEMPPPTGKDGDATGMTGAAPLNHVALVRELGHKCLANAKRELDQKQGAEFDRCYMGMQLAAHAGMLTMLEVFPSHASDKLRATLEEGKSAVQSHLEHAKQIAKSLEAKPGTSEIPDRKK